MTDLSGRVDALENTYSYINQQLLQRPDLVAFSQFQTIWNQQIDTIESTIYTMKTQLQNLQGMYVNMSIGDSNNLTAFRAHTGNVDIHDPRGLSIQRVTGGISYVLTGSELVLADATLGSVTGMLSGVSTTSGYYFTIKKIDSSINPVYVTGDSTIDGVSRYTLTGQYDKVTLVSDGTLWYSL